MVIFSLSVYVYPLMYNISYVHTCPYMICISIDAFSIYVLSSLNCIRLTTMRSEWGRRGRELVFGLTFILLHLEIPQYAFTGSIVSLRDFPVTRNTRPLSLAWCRSVTLLRRYVSTISHCNLPTSKIGLLPIRAYMCLMFV